MTVRTDRLTSALLLTMYDNIVCGLIACADSFVTKQKKMLFSILVGPRVRSVKRKIKKFEFIFRVKISPLNCVIQTSFDSHAPASADFALNAFINVAVMRWSRILTSLGIIWIYLYAVNVSRYTFTFH